MKSAKLLINILLSIIIVGSIFGYYSHAQAQKKAEIVEYLNQRLQAQNIPVTAITILEASPLQLQIVIKSVNDHVTPEDLRNLRKVDREVFIVAHKNGYNVERYSRILQDSQGNQLYKLEQGATNVKQPIVNPSGVSDNDVRKLMRKRIDSLINEYNIQNVAVTIDVSTVDGTQSLDMQLVAPSLDQAYSVFGFLHDQLIYPLDPIIAEVNSQGEQIVVSSYEIKDNEDNLLFFYFYDYQLQRGTWSNAANFLVNLGDGGPP